MPSSIVRHRLVSSPWPATENDVWARHIDDSSQLVTLIPSNATSLVDLGSGAGLPGMVIAILRPELQVTLVEQDQRKAAFLKEAKRTLGLRNVTVEAMDIAKLDRKFDVVTARALAPLTVLLGMACGLMEAGAVGIFPKGATHAHELAEAAKKWQFEYHQKPSATNAQSSLITISKLTEIPNLNQG